MLRFKTIDGEDKERLNGQHSEVRPGLPSTLAEGDGNRTK